MHWNYLIVGRDRGAAARGIVTKYKTSRWEGRKANIRISIWSPQSVGSQGLAWMVGSSSQLAHQQHQSRCFSHSCWEAPMTLPSAHNSGRKYLLNITWALLLVNCNSGVLEKVVPCFSSTVKRKLQKGCAVGAHLTLDNRHRPGESWMHSSPP